MCVRHTGENQQPDKAVHPQMTLIKIRVFPSA
jgi:hypothetical protein